MEIARELITTCYSMYTSQVNGRVRGSVIGLGLGLGLGLGISSSSDAIPPTRSRPRDGPIARFGPHLTSS